MKKSILASTLFAFAAMTACASTVPAPQELVAARAAYEHARTGPAARLALVDLHAARQDLDRAEASYLDAPESDSTHDLAYVALRHAEAADVHGAALAADEQRATAERQGQQLQGQHLQQAQSALANQQTQLATEHAARTAAERELQTAQQAREAAERQAATALESLRQANAVREDQRGTVITLSGEVLFAPGRATLLGVAQQQLDHVAEALAGQPDRHVVVEGHTDSRGSAEANQALSLSRAQAVRDYLISRGLAAAQVEAVGLGPTRPIADNGTADGRASNRRVEIILARPAAHP